MTRFVPSFERVENSDRFATNYGEVANNWYETGDPGDTFRVSIFVLLINGDSC